MENLYNIVERAEAHTMLYHAAEYICRQCSNDANSQYDAVVTLLNCASLISDESEQF